MSVLVHETFEDEGLKQLLLLLLGCVHVHAQDGRKQVVLHFPPVLCQNPLPHVKVPLHIHLRRPLGLLGRDEGKQG